MPLFLYQVGVQVQLTHFTDFQNGMIFIGLYYFFERFGVLISSLGTSRIIYLLGVRNGMVISQLIYLVSLGLFVIVKSNPILLLPILILEAVRLPLYWSAYYTLFSENAVLKHMGQSVGTIEFFSRLVMASVPAITGLIIVEFGFPYVFLVALVLQVLSIIALFLVEQHQPVSKPTIFELTSWLKEPGFRILSLSMIGKYMADSMQFLWPFFVLLLVGSAEQVGYLYFVVFFVSLLLTYFSGWFVDHSKSRRPFSVSALTLGSIWLIRGFIGSVWSIMTVDVFNTLAESVFTPFYDSLMLKRGKGKKTLNYFTYREMVISFAGIFFWGVFILYFFFFNTWRSSIVFAIIGILLSLQLSEKHKNYLEQSQA